MGSAFIFKLAKVKIRRRNGFEYYEILIFFDDGYLDCDVS